MFALINAAAVETLCRYSALAISFNVAIVVAGLAPTVAAWLVTETGSLMVPAFYLMVASVIGITDRHPIWNEPN